MIMCKIHSGIILNCSRKSNLLWPTYGIGQTIIFSSCGFFVSFFFLSLPNLSSLRLDACHTKKSPPAHHRTTLSAYIFATKTHIDNRKKNLLSSNISSRRPHNMVNFGILVAEIGLVVWGTSANFNGFRVLAALLHGI